MTRVTAALWAVAFGAMAWGALCSRPLADPPPPEAPDDPMDGVLPPRLVEALEYVAYYFATACDVTMKRA